MSKVHIAKWCAGALLVSFITASQAATISLSPLSQNVALGNPLSPETPEPQGQTPI